MTNIANVEIVDFEVPNTDTWGDEEKRLVLALLTSEPCDAWIKIFSSEVAAIGSDFFDSEWTIERGRLTFAVSRGNVSRRCLQFHALVVLTQMKLLEANSLDVV